MSRAAATAWPSEDHSGRWWLFAGLLVLGSVATAGAAIVSNGNILVAVAPVVMAIGLAVLWVAPIRISLFALVFLGLAIDATDEGPWNSPLAPLGALIGHNLNKTIPIGALALPGIAAAVGVLLLLHVHRRLSRTRTDDFGREGASPATLWGIILSFCTVLGLCAVGYQNGGDMQMAKIQVQFFVILLAMSYLVAVTFRGGRDQRVLAVVVIAAACFKALLALYVATNVDIGTTGAEAPFATTHGDSILFAAAIAIVAVRFAEAPVRRNALLCVLTLPLLIAGVVANNRRLAWVEIAATAVAFVAISRRSQLKRLMARTALLALPIAIAYVAIGWNSNAEIFAPVQLFRSVGDSEVDRSTLYRDLENYNLLHTLRWNPFVGTGFGHPFDELVDLDDISFFKEYRYMPHNSILGLWAFGGAFGFTGLSLAMVVAVFLAARSYTLARTPDERTAAFSVIAIVLIHQIHCWGDIGFSERNSIYLVGPAIAVAGQLAVSTGAWKPPARRTLAVRS